MIPKKYGDLYDLIEQDDEAYEYFETLPDYVQDAMSRRADSVCTLENLRDYAENLTRGDQ